MPKIYTTGELFLLALQIIFIAILTYSVSRVWSELILAKTSRYIKTKFKCTLFLTIVATIIAILLLLSVFAINNHVGKNKSTENTYYYSVTDLSGQPHNIAIRPETENANRFMQDNNDLTRDLYISLPNVLSR